MNTMDITDKNYTKDQTLYHLVTHVSGESEARIAPFYGNIITADTKTTDCIFQNCRDLNLENIRGGGQIIDATFDVGIFADNITEAIKQIEQIQFLDLSGVGGVINLTPPNIYVHQISEVPDFELAAATGHHVT
ncbi:hypothetical protein MTBPR1_120098 [Candidatus Terasakiella magnetica]|uniref:Uncharacterized protein n=1 Tax=Candidatus Terasakiella magnetica TaxID=1867952 RepID=A0A1C3REY3_9PROT|nr:hypothetical protein [Candidatus Terasakiella magnetica]SCA55792.1 hypothetical protein MTBPR1_120098 [Candidatus Terasakiella magnetica]